jgi:hypothetical protein
MEPSDAMMIDVLLLMINVNLYKFAQGLDVHQVNV